MGRVLVTARIENLGDLYKASLGDIEPDEVRRVEVVDALVDTGATMLSMPGRLIRQLGLSHVRVSERCNQAAGPETVKNQICWNGVAPHDPGTRLPE